MALAPNPLNAYPNTGLAQLGDTLLRASGDYANIRLRDQEQERRRAQQLADLQDAKLYSEGQFDKQRGLLVDDRGVARTQQLADKDAAVSTQKGLFLWQQRQARIRELIDLGLLSQADAADDVKIAAADAAATERTALLRAESDLADKEAKAYVNDLAMEAKAIRMEMQGTEKKLSEIPDTPTPPTQKEVDSSAKTLAANAKADYNNDAVRTEYQALARKELEKTAEMRLYFAQQKAETYRQMLNGSRYRLQAIDSQLSDFGRRKILPTVKPPSAVQAMESASGEEYGGYTPQSALAAPAPAGLSEAPAAAKIATAGGAPPQPASPSAMSAPSEATPPSSGAPGANPAIAALLFGDKILPAVKSVPSFLRGALAFGGTAAVKGFPLARAGYLGYSAGDVVNSAPTWLGGKRLSDYMAAPFAPKPGDYMSESRAKALGLRRSLDQPLRALNPLSARIPESIFPMP